MMRSSRALVLALAFACASACAGVRAAGPTPPTCPDGPVCVETGLGGTTVFTERGEEIALPPAGFSCHVDAPAPKSTNITATAGASVLELNATKQTFGNCTLYEFTVSAKSVRSATFTMRFDAPSGNETASFSVESLLEACYPKEFGCTTTCCNGGEKWSAAAAKEVSYDFACDPRAACCLSKVFVGPVNHAEELSIEGLLRGDSCPGQRGGEAPFEVTQPLPLGRSTEIKAGGKTYTLSVTDDLRLAVTSGDRPYEGNGVRGDSSTAGIVAASIIAGTFLIWFLCTRFAGGASSGDERAHHALNSAGATADYGAMDV